MNRWRVLRLALTMVVSGAINANGMGWQTFTSMDNVMDIEYAGGAIWGAAEGGIFRFDIVESEFELISRADGLLGESVYCLAIDSTGKVWSSGLSGNINVYDMNTGNLFTISSVSTSANHINDLALFGTSVFAAADNGIYEIYYEPEYDEYLVKDTYSQLGGFQAEAEVFVLHAFDGYLWAGTNYGAARIDLSLSIKRTSDWENYTTGEGLTANNIRGLAAVNDTLIAASRFNGISKFDGSSFIPHSVGMETKELRSLADTLYAATNQGVRRYSGNSWETIGSGTGTCLTVLKTPDGELWTGRENTTTNKGGLSRFNGLEWENYWPNTPAGKYINGMMVDSQGRLWCGAGGNMGEGVYIFDGINWQNYTAQDSLYNTHFYNEGSPQTFVENPDGQVWCGSFGSGIAVFMPDGEQKYYNAIDSLSEDSIVRVTGTGNYPDYCVIGDFVLDFSDNIWLINRESANFTPLIMVPSDYTVEHSANIEWEEFTLSDIGANEPAFDYLAIDQQERLWMGGKSNDAEGIRCFDFGGTPFVRTGDLGILFTANSNNLLNNSIQDLAVDHDNRLWAASTMGVNYFDIYEDLPTSSLDGYLFDTNYDLYGKHVNCIAVDPMNNKWFGTELEGVVVLGADNYTILEVYSEDTHPLLDNRILDITFNAETGVAYIATPEGISSVQTPYRTFSEELGSLKMGPVPFYPDDEEPLTFSSESLTNGATVKVFTHTGLLVRKLSFTEASLGWNGRNENGDLVGSGVYLVTVSTAEGDFEMGKVPVIRK